MNCHSKPFVLRLEASNLILRIVTLEQNEQPLQSLDAHLAPLRQKAHDRVAVTQNGAADRL